MLGWKCKELENNDDFVFPWLCLQMFWCRKRFAWMTKKKFSFHFSGERIKLQKFGLSFKMKVPKNCTRIKNRQFAISSYLTCDQENRRMGEGQKNEACLSTVVLSCVMLYQSPKIIVASRKRDLYVYYKGNVVTEIIPVFVSIAAFANHAQLLVQFPCWNWGETENRQLSKSLILSEVIKSVGVNFLPAVLIGGKIRKNNSSS